MSDKAKTITINELLRKACIYAEQDRLSFIDAMNNDVNDEYVQEALAFLKCLQKYRKKRWGQTRLEQMCAEATGTVNLMNPVEVEDYFKKNT